MKRSFGDALYHFGALKRITEFDDDHFRLYVYLYFNEGKSPTVRECIDDLRISDPLHDFQRRMLDLWRVRLITIENWEWEHDPMMQENPKVDLDAKLEYACNFKMAI